MTGKHDRKTAHFAINGENNAPVKHPRAVRRLLLAVLNSAREGFSVSRGPDYYTSSMFRSSRWF